MIGRIAVAVAYGVGAAILVFIIGVVLGAVGIKPLTALGDALQMFCWAIGLVVGVLAYFASWSLPGRAP